MWNLFHPDVYYFLLRKVGGVTFLLQQVKVRVTKHELQGCDTFFCKYHYGASIEFKQSLQSIREMSITPLSVANEASIHRL